MKSMYLLFLCQFRSWIVFSRLYPLFCPTQDVFILLLWQKINQVGVEQCISDSCRDGILLVSVKNYQFKRQLFSKFTIIEDMNHANRAIFN